MAHDDDSLQCAKRRFIVEIRKREERLAARMVHLQHGRDAIAFRTNARIDHLLRAQILASRFDDRKKQCGKSEVGQTFKRRERIVPLFVDGRL